MFKLEIKTDNAAFAADDRTVYAPIWAVRNLEAALVAAGFDIPAARRRMKELKAQKQRAAG